MDVKVLGSVSPTCKGKHNCPGYLVSDKSNKILLDAGNGISRNLSNEDYKNLTIIITHLHKDHFGELLCMGYNSFVLNRLGIIDKKIKVYIPRINNEMTKQEQVDYNFLVNFKDDCFLEFRDYNEYSEIDIDNLNISFCKTIHPVDTYAVKITDIDNNKKVVYSSDTGYGDNRLIDFIEEADLFICESSYLKDQKKHSNNHLNTVEAASIARDSKVDKLLLTHFYPDIDSSSYVKEVNKVFKKTYGAKENDIYHI